MEFFCYHRDRPGSVTLREELQEQHWSYMDRYKAEMIARGPTLAGDGDTPTGSVHVLRLPDPAAARAFAFDEPNYQAGVYRDVLLRRWRNLLGRTMWDFPGGPAGGNRYLVLGLGTGPAADLTVPPGRDELIAYGPLLSDNGSTWLGTAVLARAPDPDTARAILTPDRYAGIEVHSWQFGGRPAGGALCRVFHGSLGVGAVAGGGPLVQPGLGLGDGPAVRLLDPVAAAAACCAVAGAGPAALVVGDGVVEVGVAGVRGAGGEGAGAVADLDQVAEGGVRLVAA